MRRQGLSHARPTAAAVCVVLIEHRDPPTPDPDEVVDQPGGLLAVGGAQVEGELAVRRLPLRLGPCKREEEVDLLVAELLQQWKHSSDRRSAHVPEEQENAFVLHKLDRVGHARVRLIPVIVELEDDSAAVDPAVVVDLVEIGHRAAVELGAEPPRRTGKCRGHTQDDLVVLFRRARTGPGSRVRFRRELRSRTLGPGGRQQRRESRVKQGSAGQQDVGVPACRGVPFGPTFHSVSSHVDLARTTAYQK